VTELWEVQHILLNLASITRAQSVQGALFQLALLTETLHVDLFQNIPTEEIQDSLLDHEQKCIRLIHSVASLLERMIGQEAAEEASDIWLCRSDDNLSKIERTAGGPIGFKALSEG
jgi:hypothetical protein